MTSDINPCVKIFAREYWCESVLVDPCVALYMLFSNRDMLKATFNDEVILWEVVGTLESPDINNPEGDKSLFYLCKDHTPVGMSDLGDLVGYHVLGRNVLEISFRKSVVVTLSISPASDGSSIEVKIT